MLRIRPLPSPEYDTLAPAHLPRLNDAGGHVAHFALLSQLVLVLQHQTHPDADEAGSGGEKAKADVGKNAHDELRLPLPWNDVSVSTKVVDVQIGTKKW